ncbi:MAG: S-formylglutathione hydrolase [Micavibrio sp.]
MKEIESHRCFGGTLSVYEHESKALGCAMQFSIFLPPQAKDGKVPFITFLSGLTCTHENFTTKAGAYAAASREGIAVVAPDTSPRGEHVPDDPDSYDFGKGAGFYIDAVQEPWAKNYRMETYIADELNDLVCKNFPVAGEKQGLCGHSMGGHGALTLYLKYPDLYKSASAFSPIVAPAQVPWGKKAFAGYLGNDPALWEKHDACALMRGAGNRGAYPAILIDQGMADQFLEEQLKPDLFEAACKEAGQPLILRRREGYDHSYYFIQSFMEDHIRHHASILA